MRSAPVALVLLATLLLGGSAHARRYRHVVLPGETLSSIAKRYHVSKQRIRRWNRLKKGATLRAGRKLSIRTSYPVRRRFKGRYAIKRGDTLGKIARRHKMRVSMLRRLNPRLRKGRLIAGRTLWVIREGPRPKGRRGMYQLTSGPGYRVRNSSRAWGTFLAVTRLMEVLTAHSRKFPRARPIRVYDLSRKGGGYLAPHKSHRTGRDVDLIYPLKKGKLGYRRATPRTLNLARTWDLVQRFLATEDVVYIFIDHRLQRVLHDYVVKHRKLSKKERKEVFQYPRSRRAMTGIIRHEPGHATHMHVRFRKMRKSSPNS